MGQKNKQGLFSKFLSVLSGRSDDGRDEDMLPKSPYAPKEEEPVDLKFVQSYTQNGGYFLYGESIEEAMLNIRKIMMENQHSSLFVPEKKLHSLFSVNEIPFNADEPSMNEAVVTTCEALIAFNGGIMVTDYQLGVHKLTDLPETHIILACTDQVVNTLSSGMARVNNTYRENRPNQITILKGATSESVRQAASDPNRNRILYLLLIEGDLK